MLKYLKSILSIIFVIFFILTITVYTKNLGLIKFNTFILNEPSIISEQSLFNYINYNLDSTDFYSSNDIKKFQQKIYDLESIGVIKDINISYSIPNKIFINIFDNKQIYIIETKLNQFILDEEGFIYNVTFNSDLSSIPNIRLNFLNDAFYQDWNSNEELQLKTLINNININKSNNKYLLDVFEILHSFKNNYLYTHINSISVNENTIDILLDKTKIFFSKSTQDIKVEINKMNQIVNNQSLFDSLKIDDLTELKEIKLFFDKQIIIKS